jgi:hypothetical protein
VTVIEATAVRPRHLPAYVASLQRLLASMNLEASFYGHAGAGLLHVRPILDLHSLEDLRKFRHLALEVSALVRHVQRIISRRTRVGIARTEFLQEQLGDTPARGDCAKSRIPSTPHHLLKSGRKIIPDGRFQGGPRSADYSRAKLTTLPFEPKLAFAAKDGSFISNLEQCNGCGGCLQGNSFDVSPRSL